MPKGKHLTLDDRRSIQIGLGEGRSFKDIADEYRACISELKLLQRKTAKVLDRMAHIYDSEKEG